MILWVARHADTRFVNDVSTEPLYRPSPLPPEDSCSEMTIPLIFSGEVLGVLDVHSNRLNAFSEQDRFVFETLADNIAIAMRNAQPFRTEIWRRQVADSMREVVGMLSGDASLQAVLEAILVELQRTLPLEVAAIWLADRAVTLEADPLEIVLRLSAMQGDIQSGLELELGCTPEEIFNLNLLHFSGQASPRETSSQPSEWLLNAIQSGKPIFRPAGAPFDPLAGLLEFPADHSAITAPLKIGESIFGVRTLLHSSARRYGREAYTIVETFGNYAAVAIENTRLISSQEEAAYVSVAFLQVAQAVVSSPDLVEALGAIVRLTPILAGVDRAVVFLWDPSRQAFRSVQSYGTAHDTALFEYKSGEFPLLDAVIETNRLMVYPLIRDKDIFKDAPDDWSFLIPPDLDEIEILLDEADRLLLALPLSVKGDILGVLLVEEPVPAHTVSFHGRSNRRLRGKRLEILTGVSQQSALAVQNDILQHEMVERERLEREFQLARQIQLTFLPEVIPEFAGWSLRACWRTAREVGGDFYDIFELPNQRLGLVIADVADKGMPAALFMAVVRCLVRASLEVVSSPSAVLERVNRLVVPDAANGLFISLAYAVLDLNTGTLDYANAGHNPPLVVRKDSCTIEFFERGGMALGVLEDNRIQGGSTHLEPGNYLVMYTDGVTEAFSPEGAIFGEERLYSIITEEIACVDPRPDRDAQHLVDAIDQRVSEFIGQMNRTDDLTLLVLKRL